MVNDDHPRPYPHHAEKKSEPQFLITGTLYDFLKFLAQIALPALGTLYFTVAAIWMLPNAQAVVGTIMAVDAFFGVLLGISSSNYNASEKRFAGDLVAFDKPDGGKAIRLELNDDIPVLKHGDELTFKVKGT